jgi:adenosine/AMP kinase
MDKIKNVPEVCTIYAATANPLELVVAETEQGRGIVAVIDGLKSKGIETEEDVTERKRFLRKIGYKLE